MTKTKAMVMERFNQPLVLREVEIPALAEGQILVRMSYAGICGSDVSMWHGEDARVPLPMILGHEGVGYIEKLSTEAVDVNGKPLKEGDFILWNRGVSCGRCYYCQIARTPELCQDRWVYGIHRGFAESPHLLGCYAQHIMLEPGTDIFSVDPQAIDPAVLVSASCSGATVAHAFELGRPQFGDIFLIQGAGPLGLFAVAFAKQSGASQIIMISGTESRLQLAEQMGATMVLNRRKTSVEERRQIILDATYGRGVDVALEAAGTIPAFVEGIGLVRQGGTYLSVGFGVPVGTMELDCFEDVVKKNLRIQGVWVSDTRHTQHALAVLCNNPDAFRGFVSHRMPLEEAGLALEMMANQEMIKGVLEFK